MTNQGHYFNVSKWGREDRYFTRSSEPREGLPVCRAKAFLSYSLSPRRSNPRPPALQLMALPAVKTDLIKSLKCYEGGPYESSEAQMSKLR